MTHGLLFVGASVTKKKNGFITLTSGQRGSSTPVDFVVPGRADEPDAKLNGPRKG